MLSRLLRRPGGDRGRAEELRFLGRAPEDAHGAPHVGEVRTGVMYTGLCKDILSFMRDDGLRNDIFSSGRDVTTYVTTAFCPPRGM